MKRVWDSQGAVAMLIVWLVAPAHGLAEKRSPDQPKAGGILRLALLTDPHSLDAAQVFSNEEGSLGFLTFNTLIDSTPDGGFVPALSESLPETAEDSRIHTFRLRQGVRFSDGQELTADDVTYTFERLFDPATASPNGTAFSSLAGHLAFTEARSKEAADPRAAARHHGGRWIEPVSLSGVRAVNRYTVRFQLDQPDLSFLKELTTLPGAIVSRRAAEKEGTAFGRAPVGTGPFMLKEWMRGARLKYVRNPCYFRSDRPGPSAIEVLVNVDLATQSMMFERGELDFQLYLDDPEFILVQRSPGLRQKLRVISGTSPTFIFLNCELPPFTNRLVRLAVNYAVNKEELVKILANRAEPARGPLPLTVRGFNANLPAYPYDPVKARALLAEAGLTNGFMTTLWVNRDSPSWMKIALYVQQCLREIGVTAEIKEVTYSTMLDAGGRRRTVPMGVWDWLSGIDDPKDTLDSLWNGDNLTDESCINMSFYANPHVQQWFRDGLVESDPARRLDIYHRIERQIVDDVPCAFLVQMNTDVLIQPWLKGIVLRGLWPPARFENCWLDR